MMCAHGMRGAQAGSGPQAQAGGCCKDGKCSGCAKQASSVAAKEAKEMNGAAKAMTCADCCKDGKCACCGEGGSCGMQKPASGAADASAPHCRMMAH
jgi:hypothetical protein